MIKKILLIWVILVGLLAPFALTAQANSHDVPSTDALQSPYFIFRLGGSDEGPDTGIVHPDVKEEKWIRGGINFLFERAITIMAATVGTAAVLMITLGGFMVLASGGRQQWVDTGKSYILKSLIGLAAALGAYILVQTVQILIKSIYGS